MMASELTRIIDDGLPSTVSEFFTPAEYATISELEKKRLINLRLNYEALRSAGFPVSPPEFMCRKVKQERKIKKKQKQKVDLFSQSSKGKKVPDVQVTRVLRQTDSRIQRTIHAEKINKKKAKILVPPRKKMQMRNEEKCVTRSQNQTQKTYLTVRTVPLGMDSGQQDEIYSCSQCYISFSQFDYLQRHMRRRHHHKYLEFLQHYGCLDTAYRHNKKTAGETLHRPRACEGTHLSLKKSEPPQSGDITLPDKQKCSNPTASLPNNRRGSQMTMENKHDLEVDTQFSSSEYSGGLIGKQSDSQGSDKVKLNLKTQSVESPCKGVVGSACTASLHVQRPCLVDTHRCSLCGFSCFLISEFKRHCKKHTGGGPYRCDVCFVTFPYMSDFNRHYRKHTGEKPYKCDVCSVSFTLHSNLKSHYRKHSGEKPYKCDVCSMSFTQLSNLKIHYRKHSGEKPYKCDVCSMSFTQQSNLKSHYRKHSGEKSYKCDVCLMSFTQQSNLKSHYRKHSGEKPYKCDVCFVSFPYVSSFNSQSRIHTGDRPYKCDVCSVSFTQHSSLKGHYRRHTEGKPS